jgi:hypothetical protein
MANLSDKFFEVLSDYSGSVQDRMKAYLVATYSYDADLNVYDMEFKTLRDLGYTGALNDMWNAYLVSLGGYGLGAKAALLGSTFYAGAGYSVNGLNPALVFDFDDEYYRTSGSTSTFSDSITHSATTNATMVDSDGLLKWRPHNLLSYSEQFDNAAWQKVNAGVGSIPIVTTNAGIAPDGTSTANRVQFDLNGGTTSGDVSRLRAAIFTPSAVAGKFWVKSNDSSTYKIGFNLGSTLINIDAGPEWTLIENVWSTSGSIAFDIQLRGAQSPANSDTADILVWGAHLYRSDLGGMVNNPDRGDSYVPTTTSAVYLPRRGHHVYNGSAWVNEGLLHESEERTNLHTNTTGTDMGLDLLSEVSASAWADGPSKKGLTVTASATNNSHLFRESLATVNTTVYTAAVYAEEDTHRYLQILVNSNTGAVANFDLRDGSINAVVTTAAVGYGAIPFGDGFICWLAFTANGSTNYPVYALVPSISAARAQSWNALGTESIKIDMLQFEAGSTPSSYIPNAGATSGVTRAAETLTVPAANLPWPEPVVIGEELVTNGTFDTGDLTGWIDVNDHWTVSSGAAFHASTLDFNMLLSDVSSAAGSLVVLTFDVSGYSGTSGLRVQWRTSDQGVSSGGSPYSDQPGGISPAITSDGSYTYVGIVPADAVYIAFARDQLGDAVEFSIDNISVREINPLSVSIQMQGRQTYSDGNDTANNTFVAWPDTVSGNYIWLFGDSDRGTGGVTFRVRANSVINSRESNGSVYSPGVLVPYNISVRVGSTFLNGATDGTSLTAIATPVSIPDVDGTDLNLAPTYNGTIKLFRVWADDLADAGIEEATT